MYLVINKCVTAVKISNFSGHYLPNRSTLDIGVLGYIGIVQHKEHPPEMWHIPPGTPCITVHSLVCNKLSVPKMHNATTKKTCLLILKTVINLLTFRQNISLIIRITVGYTVGLLTEQERDTN